MAGSPFRFRNMALVLAAGGFIAIAAAQACSPGTLDAPESYKGQVDMYAPSTGSGGGGPVGSGGKAGVGMGGSTGSGGGGGKTCGVMQVPSGCATFSASLASAFCTTCHTKAGAAGFKTIDFITDPSSALVGKNAIYGDLGAVETPGMCPATREVLLDRNDFDKSLFVTKLRGTSACGTSMPQSLPMTAADKDCLLRWACSLIQ